MKRFLLLASLTLAGCVTEGPSGGPTPPGATEGACGAPGLQGLVGQNRKVLTTM